MRAIMSDKQGHYPWGELIISVPEDYYCLTISTYPPPLSFHFPLIPAGGDLKFASEWVGDDEGVDGCMGGWVMTKWVMGGAFCVCMCVYWFLVWSGIL